MSRQRRLGRLEKAAQAARQRDQVPIGIGWVTSDGVIEPASGAHVILTLNQSRKDDPPAWAPEWMDSDAPSAPPDRPTQFGQRPRPPSPAAQASALETLRERARLGQYVGELPVSEAELAAEHRRREALRRDAELIRQTSRSVSSAPARQAVNRLAAWEGGVASGLHTSFVFSTGDALAEGLTSSLARPDRNATGLSVVTIYTTAKKLHHCEETRIAEKRLSPDARGSPSCIVPNPDRWTSSGCRSGNGLSKPRTDCI
jgi:hypothetical protein